MKKTAECSAVFGSTFIPIVVLGLAQVRVLIVMIQRFPAIFAQVLAVVVLAQMIHLLLSSQDSVTNLGRFISERSDVSSFSTGDGRWQKEDASLRETPKSQSTRRQQKSG